VPGGDFNWARMTGDPLTRPLTQSMQFLFSLRNLISRSMGGMKHATSIFSTAAFYVLFALSAPTEVRAVLIATGDGTGNTTPHPTEDPGFANVGKAGGLTGVYVRNGWVLTANHVGERSITFLGVTYDPVPGSGVRFQNPDPSPVPLADLMAFKLLDAKPPLPDLAITDTAPTLDTLVTIIGQGRDRGTATTWMGAGGWNWAGSTSMRWGTNIITDASEFTLGTQSFWFVFDNLNTGKAKGQHEAALVDGDSGGAAFTGSGASAELIGILIGRSFFTGQPANTSLYGNAGVVADLFAYSNDILPLIDQPDCGDGLDDDGDGLIDYPNDPGCTDALDPDERGAIYECDNGIDDDQDGLIDFPEDDGCVAATDETEAPVPVSTGLLGAGLLALCSLALIASARLPLGSDVD
jgi:hypothetical protein